MRVLLSAFTLSLFFGCRSPMPVRLKEKMQSAVDRSWENVFATPNHLDRTMLLDVLTYSSLYEYGIDRFEMISEKDVRGGVVRMEVHFDRLDPSSDRFSVIYMDKTRRVLRSEYYTREEVDQRRSFLFAAEDCDGDPMSLGPEWQEECRELKKRRERRVDEIGAILEPMLSEKKAERLRAEQSVVQPK